MSYNNGLSSRSKSIIFQFCMVYNKKENVTTLKVNRCFWAFKLNISSKVHKKIYFQAFENKFVLVSLCTRNLFILL